MRTSLKEVAEAAGVSKITASRALRGVGGVSKETAQRICRMAERMKYVADPTISRLASQRWGNRGQTPDSTIAYIWHGKETSEMDAEGVLAGVHAGAHKYGYRVETINLQRRGNTRGLDRELQTKGLRALILGSIAAGAPRLQLSWQNYTVVKAHVQEISLPPFSVVHQGVDDALAFACAKVANKGYKKIGIVLLLHSTTHNDDIKRLDMVAALNHRMPLCGVSIDSLYLQMRSNQTIPEHMTILQEWINRTKPEAILGFNSYVSFLIKRTKAFKVPEDIAYANIVATNIVATNEGGLVGTRFAEGYLALRLTDLLLRSGEKGIPSAPIIQQTRFTWIDSPQLPVRRRLGPTERQRIRSLFPQLEWEWSLAEARRAGIVQALSLNRMAR